MMSISQVTSAGAATAYYQADNYYAKDGSEGQGIWYGQAAKDLELSGKAVSPDEFVKILSGELPNGQNLYRVVDDKKKHLPGYDITFSAPKSVSIMSEVVGDKDFSDAHDRAVTATLDWVEANVTETRKFNKAIGKQEALANQKMIAALFKHDISRNEDPQLHTHCVIANAVLGADGKYRSLHSPELFRNKMLIGEIYRSELKANIRKKLLGRIERTHPDGRFELKDVDQALIEEFSTRSKDIDEYLGEGAHSAEDRAAAALRTWKGKQDTARDDLRKEWDNRLAKLGYTRESILQAVQNPKGRMENLIQKYFPKISPAVENALEHLSENSSTFPRRDVLRFMLAEGMGNFRVDAANAEIDHFIDQGLIKQSEDGTTLYTQETLDRELETLALERNGRGAVDPILPRKDVQKTNNGHELTAGQFNASSLILTSPNRVDGVQGYAGTGKTFMLSSVAEQASKAGYKVLGLAPTSNAAKSLGEDAGIRTQTLQRYLQNPFGNRKTILFVDEASMISTNQMLDLLSLAQKKSLAKVVLIGDSKQLEGVAAGAPFRALQQNGMRLAVMDEIKRQSKDRHLDAVISASSGDIERAFKKLGNDILEVPFQDLSKQTAAAWLKSADRENAAIVVTTNAMAESVNTHVKEALMAEGIVSEKSMEITSLKSLRLSEMQKRYSDNYRDADKIRFNRSYTKLNVLAGDTLDIRQVRDDGVIELIKNDRTIEFRPNRDATGNGSVEAFRSEPMHINEGDRIRWTRPDYANGIQNMDQGVVLKVGENEITFKMADGSEVSFNSDHSQLNFLNHAWAQTGHAYQGQTINHIIAAMPSLSGLTNQKSFYIDISRARHEVTFLTDDIDRLRNTLKERTGEERTALDLLREKESAQGFDQKRNDQIERLRELTKETVRSIQRSEPELSR